MPTPYPYQTEGVRWLRERGSGLLADEPGVGKTATALLALDAPALIVCPASLRVNWQRELAAWRPELKLGEDAFVVGYEELGRRKEYAGRLWNTLVCDEAHYLKNLKIRKRVSKGPQRGLSVLQVAERSQRRILLTGTPIMNRPLELYPLLKLVAPGDWGSEFDYGREFCNGHQVRIGWDREQNKPRLAWNFHGSSNEDRLHRMIQHFMLRRLKADVLTLPPKRRRTVVVPLTGEHAASYDRAEQDFRLWVYRNKGVEAVRKAMQAEAITQMTALRGLAAAAKVDAAIDFAVRHHVAMGGRPLVIMGHHTTTLEAIGARLTETLRVGYILGGMTDKQRQKAIDAFQGGEMDVIVCSLRAASVGLTLTRASEMLVVERDFRPGDNLQAEDRIHRVSQGRDVLITYLDAAGTIDLTMAEMLRDKTRAASAIIDGEELDEAAALAQVMGRVAGTLCARPKPECAQQSFGLSGA